MMVRQFKEHKNTPDAAVGKLAFDEVKIKEGLVFDQASDKLVGFVDFHTGNESHSTDLLATQCMQFYFKSLFANFSFPCAYFLTRSVTAAQVTNMFLTGVHALHDHGFTVMLACGDGASYNRTFFRMNATENGSRAANPRPGELIFFISDPPHIFKKLRNQMFNSGQAAHHTRCMTYGGEEIVWAQVENVFVRDQAAPLCTAPLTREHIFLDSLSKMKTKLAYDVFDKSVERNVAVHTTDATKSAQRYLSESRKLLDVFRSTAPLGKVIDERIGQLQSAGDWFTSWLAQLRGQYPNRKECAKHFVAWQTYDDICLSVNGLSDPVQHFNSDAFTARHRRNHFIIPKRLSQDIVESHFSQQRAACGGNTNMTAYAYSYNNQRLITTRIAKKNRQDNMANQSGRRAKVTFIYHGRFSCEHLWQNVVLLTYDCCFIRRKIISSLTRGAFS